MIAYFFTFNKKTLSTKVPVNEIGSGINCDITLLDNTSILSPSIRLKLASSPVSYNYAWIPEFNRYYRVTNWSSNRDMWTCDLEIDLLASYATTILNSTQYVARSASDYDLDIMDTIYPTKTDYTAVKDVNTQDTLYFPKVFDSTDLVASIQTLGAPPASGDAYRNISRGGCNFYLLAPEQVDEIMQYLCVDYADFLDSTDFSQATQKLIFNPFDYIVSLKIYPFASMGDMGDYIQQNKTEAIKFGYWTMKSSPNVGILGAVKQTPVHTITHNIPLTAHPQAAARGNKMNGAPYTKRILHFEPFGDIELESSLLINAIGISCMITIDLLTGCGKLQIKPYTDPTDIAGTWYENPNGVIYVSHANMAYEVPLVNMVPSTDYHTFLNPNAAIAGTNLLGGALGYGVTAAHGAITGAGEGISIGNAASFMNDFTGYSIGDAVGALGTSVNTKGGGGSRLPALLGNPFVQSIFFNQVAENIVDHGRPLCQRRILNTLSGYCTCLNAEITIPGTIREQTAIESILNGGFFIE